MDPRERLRLFLEQRRELGETEFVLDSMGVEEAMRVLGAERDVARARPEVAPRVPRGGEAPPTNWREALTALGGAPEGEPVEASGATGGRAPAVGGPPRGQDTHIPPDLRTPSVPPRVLSPPSAPAKAAVPREGTPPMSDPQTASPIVPLEAVPTGVVIGSAAHELFGGESPYASLSEIANAVATCTRCSLYRTAKNPVPGVGSPNADLVCVGEAPGASEDEQGVPFVGQAGQLLTKILAAINLSRDEVFICNVLKHRPPGNRNPLPEEVQACSPYLVRQIELLRPKVILALGTFAAQTLLQTREPIGKLRGKIHRYYGVPLVVTYHPAALLRNPSWKRPTWEDVQLARRLLDRAAGA